MIIPGFAADVVLSPRRREFRCSPCRRTYLPVGIMKGKQVASHSPSQQSMLRVEDEDDSQTMVSTSVPPGGISMTVSQLTSPVSSPTRRGTNVAGGAILLTGVGGIGLCGAGAVAQGAGGAGGSGAVGSGSGGSGGLGGGAMEEVPTTTGGDDEEEDHMDSNRYEQSAGEKWGEKEGSLTPPVPKTLTRGGRESASAEDLTLSFSRTWRLRQQSQQLLLQEQQQQQQLQLQQQQQQPLVRPTFLKPDGAQLGVRHHVVGADARDIMRMEQGKNLVEERARYALKKVKLNEKIRPAEIRYVGSVAYDVLFLRDDTELWHRRLMAGRSSGLARMLCC